MLFYIIFGTNLLTGGPVPVAVFLPILVFRGKEISNETKPSRGSFLEQTQSRRLGVEVRDATRWPRDRRARPGGRRAPHPRGPLVAPPTYFFLLYIYLCTPKPSEQEPKPYFHRPTLCTRENPSWGLFRRSAGGGIDHGGLLHQHHSLSDDV